LHLGHSGQDVDFLHQRETDVATDIAERSYRMLWAQVVLQAKTDLDHEPIGSILFNQAAAFFVSRGEWAESRAIVADCLEMHPDELCRCGERWIADRRRRDGLAPEPPVPPCAKTAAPLPRLEALPSPVRQSRKGGRQNSPPPENRFRMQAHRATA
jgi:hypothetical protein